MNDTYDYIIVGAGSGGLRARQSTDRERAAQGAADRGGGNAQQVPAHHAARLHEGDVPAAIYVDLFLGVGAASEWPARADPARKGAGRLLFGQRHVLHARTQPGFRHLAADGVRGMELRRRAPLFQAYGDELAGCRSVPWRPGPAARRADPVRVPASRSDDGDRKAGPGSTPPTISTETRKRASRAGNSPSTPRASAPARRAPTSNPHFPRPNLHVITEATTRRVVMDGTRAVGVEYEREGRIEEARAAREVILSGGSYNSPQLLMLSGIGPADELRELGIRVVKDLPGVGRKPVRTSARAGAVRSQGEGELPQPGPRGPGDALGAAMEADRNRSFCEPSQ